MQGQGYWFRSDLFGVEPGEDEGTNPGRYGRGLAQWLASRLAERGYVGANAAPEDWGWRIDWESPAFRGWVGCGNMDGMDESAAASSESLTWHCFPVVDVPVLARLLRRDGEAERHLARLDTDLRAILATEPRITLVEEP